MSRKVRDEPLDLGRIWEHVDTASPPPVRISLRRPGDLLVVDLVLGNLRPSGETPPRLVRTEPKAAAYLVLEFQPQSFGEEAFLDATGVVDPKEKEVSVDPRYPAKNAGGEPKQALARPLPVARVRMAGGSRVAVAMPAALDGLDLTFVSVLTALRTWPMRLDVNAAPDLGYLLEAFDPGRAWLEAVTAAPAWEAATSTLLEGLELAGAGGVRTPLEQAAKRVARAAATALARGDVRGLKRRLDAVIEDELDRLAQRHPRLGESQGRALGRAALSLRAAHALPRSRGRFELDVSTFPRLPFLRLPFTPHQPSQSTTALELPYRLLVSPLESARWRHSDDEVVHRGRTELWHTRLSTGGDDVRGADLPSAFRALWSRDYALSAGAIFSLLSPDPKPFRMSLDQLDRQLLVRLMAGFDETVGRRAYIPRASVARRLMLTSLGGLLDSEGNWTRRPDGVDLEQWRHLASLGRDHYVRVVYAGFLSPFGHAASLVKVTERKFEGLDGDAAAERVAVLRQRFFIVVREPVKTYDGSGHVDGGRTFPFTSVEILTRVTPSLANPGEGKSHLDETGGPIYGAVTPKIVVPPRGVFWPMIRNVDGGDFVFDIAAVDLCGNRVTFAMPLLFVGETANDRRPGPVRSAYNDAKNKPRRTASLDGATVCFAPLPPGDDPKGDPRLPTSTLTFDAAAVTSESRFHPNFYPEIEGAHVAIRALQRLLGRLDALVDVWYPDVYRDHGFAGDKNPGEAFLQMADHPLEFGGGPGKAKSDALGALATPSMAIQGLSRVIGPAGDLANIAQSSFQPAKFFKDAKILGGISLADLLADVPGIGGADVPKLLSRELPADPVGPRRVEARFEWQTAITHASPLFIPRASGGTTTLSMKGVVISPIGEPDAASYEATAELDNFKVNLFGFVIVWFDRLRFTAKRGQKPDVTVDLHPTDSVAFGGPLEFVNQLQELIPSGGFSDPPNLAVTPSGITASYSLNLPNIEVGVFALSNVSLGAGFTLPFDSSPATVRFNFSERQSPFSLTVSLLGGGGFFAIGIGSAGVKEIEAALEFGAAIAIDLGVASGGVEVKAGVYFHWLEPVAGKGSVELAGYVRLHGELSVLGIISASLTFNLQLAYTKSGGKGVVWGEASLVVEIEILFLSMDVSVKCRREFASDGADPTFLQLIPSQATWGSYCAAFAEEAA